VSHSSYNSSSDYKIPEGAVMSGAVYDRPYTVRGITYYRLKSVQSFRQKGIASWYGKEEHGKLTANGERYNMYAMTAAHKELPLGSEVMVKCLKTGRSIVVRINDRGPHVPGRVIDLSYTGALKLGIVDLGLTEVELILLNGSDKAPDDGHFAVQLASFTERRYASDLASDIRRAKVVSAVVNGVRYYRVKVFGFSTRKEAEKYRNRVRGKFPGALVTTE
jgi:rare lipoprotein A